MEFDSTTKYFPPKVLLKEACPWLFDALKQHFEAHNQTGIVEQLPRVFIAAQRLHGTPEDFRFLAYPIPRLTYEQRKNMAFEEVDSLIVELGKSESVRIDISGFGQIEWFYITGLPGAYSEIDEYLSHK